MKTRKLLFTLAFALTLSAAQYARAIPTVTINDLTGPIVVSSSGFSTFTSARIDGNPEAVWWYGTFTPSLASLNPATAAGIWTDPGSKNISDEFVVAVAAGVAYGVFLSDPATVPVSVTIPLPGGAVTLPIPTSVSISTETGKPTQISPDPTVVSVSATSSVPDNGNTILMLGFGLLAIGGISSRLRRNARAD